MRDDPRGALGAGETAAAAPTRIAGRVRDACRVCAGPSPPGHRLCGSCRDVAHSLGRPLVRAAPLALVCAGDPLYRALRQYKSGTHDVARRQGAAIRERCTSALPALLASAAPGCEVAVVVPSSAGGRPAPHPLEAVVAGIDGVPPLVRGLVPGDDVVTHRSPSARAYLGTPGLRGRRVLLVDDLYTSGAHFQSAASALVAAGAARVEGVVVARYVRPR